MATIVRGPRAADHFTIISNGALRDERLSWKARGLLAYLLSMDTGWNTSVRRLAEVGPDGTTSVESALKELEECGYLDRHQSRDQGDKAGTFSGTEYHVRDESTVTRFPSHGGEMSDSPVTRFSGNGSPGTGEHSTKKTSSKKNSLKEDSTSPRAADAGGSALLSLDDVQGCITCGKPRTDGHHHREAPDTTQVASMPATDQSSGKPSKRDAWRRVAESRPDITGLLAYLADSVETCTGTRPKDSKRAFDAMRLLVDNDGRTVDQVRAAIDWSRESAFWCSVILGAESLRKNYTKMQAQAARSQAMQRPATDRGVPTSTRSPRVAQGLSLVEKYAREEGYLPPETDTTTFNPLQITEGSL